MYRKLILKFKNRIINGQKGFTLVEQVVAMGIFAMVSMIIVSTYVDVFQLQKLSGQYETVHLGLDSTIKLILDKGSTANCVYLPKDNTYDQSNPLPAPDPCATPANPTLLNNGTSFTCPLSPSIFPNSVTSSQIAQFYWEGQMSAGGQTFLSTEYLIVGFNPSSDISGNTNVGTFIYRQGYYDTSGVAHDIVNTKHPIPNSNNYVVEILGDPNVTSSTPPQMGDPGTFFTLICPTYDNTVQRVAPYVIMQTQVKAVNQANNQDNLDVGPITTYTSIDLENSLL